MKSETITTDILIVGAGPAGAAAARELVGKGYRVLVVEKKKLPRYKVCSGLIMDRAQELLFEQFGTPPEDVFSRPFHLKGVRLCLSGRPPADVPVGSKPIYNVWRSAFDHWLIRQSGAEILESHRLIDLRQSESHVEAIIEGPGEEKLRAERLARQRLRVKSSYLIGADGSRSSVRRLLDPGFERGLRYSTFVQLYCSATIDLPQEYFHMIFGPGLSAFYTWLHVKDRHLVYGVAAHSGRLIPQCIRDSTEYLSRQFGLKVEAVERKTGCLVSNMALSGNFLIGRGRVLLAGEAAGYVNVFGEGISSALATGNLAAHAIYDGESSGRHVFPLYSELSGKEQRITTKSWEIAKSSGLRF